MLSSCILGQERLPRSRVACSYDDILDNARRRTLILNVIRRFSHIHHNYGCGSLLRDPGS